MSSYLNNTAFFLKSCITEIEKTWVPTELARSPEDVAAMNFMFSYVFIPLSSVLFCQWIYKIFIKKKKYNKNDDEVFSCENSDEEEMDLNDREGKNDKDNEIDTNDEYGRSKISKSNFYAEYLKECLLIHAMDIMCCVDINEIDRYIKKHLNSIECVRKFMKDFKYLYSHTKNVAHNTHDTIGSETEEQSIKTDTMDTINSNLNQSRRRLNQSKSKASNSVSHQSMSPSQSVSSVRRSPRLAK